MLQAPRKPERGSTARRPSLCLLDRTKCERTEPLCRRCVKARCICTYLGKKQHSSTALVRPRIKFMVPFYQECSTQERSTFHLFQTQTISSISGAFDQCFWDVSVTKSMKTHRAVWHAALAVAAINERSKIRDGTELAAYFKQRYYDIALRQYSKSILQLQNVINRKQLAHADKEAILIASALYSAVCIIQEDTRAAQIHIGAFVRLFCLWMFWDGSDPSRCQGATVSNVLVTIFYRFVGHHLATRTPLPRARWDAPRLTIRSDSHLPDSNGDVRCAYAYYEIYAILISIMVRVRLAQGNAKEPQRVEAQHIPQPDLLHSCRDAFNTWKITYFDLIAQFNHTKSFYLLCLQAYVIAVEIFLCTCPPDAGLARGKLSSLFSKGLTLSQQLFALEAEAVHRGEKDFDSPALSFAPSACNLLFLICLFSHDRALRLEALSLWKAWPRQEKMWTTAISSQIIQAVLDTEGNGQLRYACTTLPALGSQCIPGRYVCTNHRVSDRRIHFLGDREAILELRTVAEEQLRLPARSIKLVW